MEKIHTFYKGNYLNSFYVPKKSPKKIAIQFIFFLWIFKQNIKEPCPDLLQNLTFEITGKNSFKTNLKHILQVVKKKTHLKKWWIKIFQTIIPWSTKNFTTIMGLKEIFCMCDSTTQVMLDFVISGTWIPLDHNLLVTLPKYCPKHTDMSIILLVDRRRKCVFAITQNYVQICLWNYNCYLFLQMVPNPYSKSVAPLENLCIKKILASQNISKKWRFLPYPIVQAFKNTKLHFKQIHLYNQKYSTWIPIQFEKTPTLEELNLKYGKMTAEELLTADK